MKTLAIFVLKNRLFFGPKGSPIKLKVAKNRGGFGGLLQKSIVLSDHFCQITSVPATEVWKFVWWVLKVMWRHQTKWMKIVLQRWGFLYGRKQGSKLRSKKLHFSIEKWAKIEKKVKNFVKKVEKKLKKVRSKDDHFSMEKRTKAKSRVFPHFFRTSFAYSPSRKTISG